MIHKWTHIVIHHSLTSDSLTVSWQAIRRYHIETLGWRDIGYHFGIELVGPEYEILVGRDLFENGAHTVGANTFGIGICFVGNFDEEMVPKKQWKRGLKLVHNLTRLFDIPIEQVVGHQRFTTKKSCPGKLFDMNIFRGELRSLYGN